MSARKVVQASAVSRLSEAALWAKLRDFAKPWHPMVAWMTAEQSSTGALIRAFRTNGDDTLYRERLTYFSDTERRYTYTHLSGIAEVEHYKAQLCVSANPGGCEVTLRADLTAPEPRATEIAKGTQIVFDAGVQAIAAMGSDGFVPKIASSKPSPIKTMLLEGTPSLALSVAGHKTRTLCLFLHGIGGNRSNWDAQITAIAPLCHTAALDLRGYGDSGLGPEQSNIDAYCDDIKRVMQHLGADRLILCGLSYGAWIATSFAMRYPETLAALVLSGGCTGMSQADPQERDAFRQSREVPLAAGQTPADFAPAVVRAISGPSASDQDRDALLKSMQAIPAATYADALRCFTNPPEKFDFACLNMPVLLMTGQHDKLAPPTEISAVAARICDHAAAPDVRFEIIADAGHVCNLEGRDTYNAYLTDFLLRVLA